MGEPNYGGVGTYIVALTDGGSGSGERIASIGSQGCVPEAPAGLGLSEVTGSSVTLSWTAPAHSAISGYRILRGTDASTLSVIAPDTGSTATSYVDAGASPSTTYVYAVVALSAAGEGAPSASASTTTPSPSPEAGAKPGKTGSDPTLAPRNAQLANSTPGATGLTLTPSFDRVTLDWTAPSGDGVSGYRIWRGASAGALTVLVSDSGSTSTSYVDETVEDDTTYHYAVAALNAGGAGPQSTSSIATLPAPRVTSLPTPEPEELLIAEQQQAADEGVSFNDNPIVTFASNLGQTNRPTNTLAGALTTAQVRRQQSFTTGPGGSGFLLNSFSFTADNRNDVLIVSLWTDELDSPGEKLAELGRVRAIFSFQDYTFEYLDVFLSPSTKYWIQFQVRDAGYDITGSFSTTNFRTTAATDMDAGSLPGWSFGGDIKFGLKGRVVTHGADGNPDLSSEVLVSNIQQPDLHASSTIGEFVTGSDVQITQSFTTGPNSHGYGLTSFTLLLERLPTQATLSVTTTTPVFTVHRDSNGSPGEVLYTFQNPSNISAMTYLSFNEYTFTSPAHARSLEANTTYWLVFGTTGFPFSASRSSTTIDDTITQPGWRITNNYSILTNGSGTWTASYGKHRLKVQGVSFTPLWDEPLAWDLPASEATPGRVRLGEYSTGTLDDASDRDWFRIDGLEHYRQYRLEVDFLGGNVVGGSFDIFSSRLGEPAVARSDLWDSNYDGHAVLDFWPVAVGISTMYVQVESSNKMNREGARNRYTGPYTITLSKLPHLRPVRRMVSNLEQRASDRLTFYSVGHLIEDGLTGHVREMAIDFTTGSHAAGYTLDKLAAYISMGRRTVTVGTATITGVGGANVAIGTPAYSVVVDDRTLTVVEGDGVSYTVQAEHAALGRRDGGHHRRLGHGRDRDPGFADLHLIELGPGADGDGEQRGGSRQHGRRCHSRPHRNGRRLHEPLGGRQGGGAGGRRRRLWSPTNRTTLAPPLSLSSGWFRRMRHPRSSSTATVPPTAPTLSSASSNGSRATRPGWCGRAETGRTRCTPGRARA